MDYQTFYSTIEKPFFAPPDWLFGLAWGIIYPLIIIAGLYLAYLAVTGTVPRWLSLLFGANLIANLAFTPLQLTLESPLLATLDIYVIIGTLLAFEYYIYKHSKVIFWLLVPYALWGAFATVLQTAIFFIN